ncbi:FKBP-type peptidyl-prolyl cis-trans isomerase [Morganella morganii]|uniref:FKBP-type peptidyl-prolyl cis-trans isomerase n=1 Tax=Morganella morganii TaxID=582 RepID=UPI0007DB89DF|nr:FKBP-type peptidyl-prolyl cis-trans isomerase [Morganella morganii]HDS6886878.1 FKBP-type peptidyl-prolyl cis-trans isomerase [Morganella morganii subsp. morganii]OAR97325.1 peptidylprolyl isomerase [Morganella morganii]UEH03718.1 FKBP-type peptidyl-prolyl cis-trans isomerase [Morganella morganii]WNJ23157.1 FKBP-type peptidyl-prolyl cis-trans isomerase [Morganella morganii]HDS7364458.1 FKBP-type peptidyl-prolyl cis-trans isomerase [Morganella morganii subsp. morganii]
MKSLFKATVVATSLAMTLGMSQAYADTAPKKEEVKLNSAFKTASQQNAYALGASLGRYMENALNEQKSIGLDLDRDQMMAGVQDAFNNKSKLSDEEINQTLRGFEEQVKGAAQEKMAREATENKAAGDKYRAAFAKEKGVEKTKSGVLYKSEKDGNGASPKETDTVVVHYKGVLIDGTQFDSSYDRNEPLTIRLDSVIKGWTEGLKQMKKGGKAKLVIPPEAAYGTDGVPGIPANSTLVFDVELLDIKPAAK